MLVLAAALTLALSMIAARSTPGAARFKRPAAGEVPAPRPRRTTRPTRTPTCRRSRRLLPLTPAEQAKRFWLPPGYRMEPVLSDPIIEDPAQIAFDGNGRMFVVELRGYFQTPEGIDLIPPIGRDLDARGSRQRRRLRAPLRLRRQDGVPALRDCRSAPTPILTMETNADEVWKYTDTNADGVADKKELFATNFGRAGNMESQQASLFWAMDNWLYSTVNAFRLRWTPNGLLKEPTGPNSSQWGVTQDNDGKVWFQGGASGHARLLPVPGALRQLRAAGSVRAGPEHRVGRADPRSATSRPGCRARACPMAR